MSVSVWLPAMPPMLAMTGSRTASNATRSTAGLNQATTPAATSAVTRFSPSQSVRRPVLTATGANMSSSSSRPTEPRIS